MPGVYPAATINLGPRVITVDHFDSANLPYAWIAITSLGNYNPKTGGHIILRTLGIAIEFPPGSTILFPSAVIQHANVPVLPHEKRASITQYVAGSLIRWIDYDYQSQKQFAAKKPEEWKKVQRGRKKAWERAVSLFSKLDELREDHRAVYGH